MSFVIDICIIVLLFCFIVRGYKKGLVKSILGLVSSVVAFFASCYFSQHISDFIYQSFIYPKLHDKISLTLSNAAVSNIRILPSEIINILPKCISGGLDDYGITNDKISSLIETSSSHATDNLMDLFKPMFINFVNPIVVSILFILLTIIFGFAIRAINRVTKVPVINQINSSLGAVLGAIEFGVILFLTVIVIRLSQPFINDSVPILSEDIIDNTLILSKLYHNSYYDSMFEQINK